MQRNQNKMLKKNTKLKWLILLLLIVIIALLAAILLNMFGGYEESTMMTSSTSSIQDNSNSSTHKKNTSNSTENHFENSSPYSVSFTGITNYQGSYGIHDFTLNHSSDGVKVSYKAAHSSETQSASLVTIDIPTKLLKVNEHSVVKNVKVNTELKLADVTNAATKNFFYPFNGNDTRVYAYYMNNGNIALAFQPKNGESQYQVIEFEPNSSMTTATKESEADNSKLQEETQIQSLIYTRLVTARDAAIEHQNKQVAEGGSPNDVQSAMSAVFAESNTLKMEYPQYSDYIEDSVHQLGY
ncbi:hypothetical protein KQI33_11850 [Enterococcus devriesei]|uniref:hypothetical protein n=1 Tax=Enterococcus devriesei TaxID=319970 RepID=UPI001C122FB3|nr:hypothetical protein [Enterococcus devriesei]MBU5366069.1 hypothetical protein [Enterococcus devriesei]